MVDRKQLDEIIIKNATNDWWQPKLFAQNTKHILPPELEILADPPRENQNYNCFLYALGLHEDMTIIQETKGFIYDSFIKYLLKIGMLEKTNTPQDGDYVVYQDLVNYPVSLIHIGVLTDNKITSKWSWGPLIKHDLWDVPKEYGDTVFYLKSINYENALKLYKKYKEFNVKPKLDFT